MLVEGIGYPIVADLVTGTVTHGEGNTAQHDAKLYAVQWEHSGEHLWVVGVGELQLWTVCTAADSEAGASVVLTARIRSEVTYRVLVAMSGSAGAICGCDRGSVSTWQFDVASESIRKIDSAPRAHQGMAVTAIAQRDATLVTAGCDGKLCIWRVKDDKTLSQEYQVDF